MAYKVCGFVPVRRPPTADKLAEMWTFVMRCYRIVIKNMLLIDQEISKFNIVKYSNE